MDSSNITDKTSFAQNITFSGSDKDYSFEILAQEVTVNCSAGTHNHGSSKVKLTNVVDYNWELRFYVGQLLAIHLNGRVVAYGIKGKKGGMVRVANLETNQRALIKEMNGLVQDISFAQIPQQIVLACVDEEGSLFVYNIEDRSDAIECTLLLCVVHPSSQTTNYRVIWCPYLPSYGEDADTLDDPAKLLVLLNESTVEVWDVSIVNSRYGTGPLQPHESYEGYVPITSHIMDVVDASFSPDGTALATASLDGYVKFFQVYMVDNEKPRCLHEWKPHGGAPLSCLLFLDNMHTYGPDSRFWKFAVTGSNYNSELKIWSCESWTCLQTIKFVANPNSPAPQLFLKARLDMTGQYLLLSDINNRILYVLQLEKNDSERVATVSSISEFLLSAPVLSYSITSADVRKFRYTSSSDDLCLCEANEDETNIAAVVIKMYVIQPKRLQECTITFQPESLLSANREKLFSLDDTTETLINLNENKSDDEQENETENNEIPKLNDLQSSVSYLIQQQSTQSSLTLMTPDAFSSPVQTSPNNKRNSHGSGLTSPITLKSEKASEDNKVENLIDTDNVMQFERPQKDNFASAGSSPSREVQEILSFKNNQEYFENLNKIESTEIESQNNFNQTDDMMFTENTNEVVWPNIPIIKANEIVKEESRKVAAAEGGSSENRTDLLQVQQLTLRLSNLENLVREQNTLIQKLQHEIKVPVSDFKSDLKDELRVVFSKELDLALSRSQIQQAKLFENYVNIQKSMEREHQDNLIASTSQILTKQLTEKLQFIVNHEMKTVVLPSIMNTFENLKHQLFLEYSQKLNTTDHLLKDNISKLVTSKAVADSLSLSIVNIIKPSLEECYKEMVGTTLIPSWERVCGSMFQQIHDTFTKGTKECIAKNNILTPTVSDFSGFECLGNLGPTGLDFPNCIINLKSCHFTVHDTASVENYMDRQRRVQDKGKDLIIQMQGVSDTIKNNAEKLTSNASQEIERQLSISFSSMQERLTHLLANLVSDQVKQGFKNHAAIFEDSVINAVRSRAVTPSPHVIDSQVQLAHIQQLLAKGQTDAAFQQALSASDLSLVVHVCEKLNPMDVFKLGNCVLPQPVILSLIQQLSADLGHNTELKHRYLEGAVLSLEPTNSLTREHMPVVLKELLQQLTNFITTNPTHKCIRNMRMLQMATQSLLRP